MKKKMLILAIILSLSLILFGCGGKLNIKNWFCTPTATQVSGAASQVVQIASLVPFLKANPVAAGVISGLELVVPTIKEIQDGYCPSEVEDIGAYLAQVATKILDANNDLLTAAKAVSTKDISTGQSVTDVIVRLGEPAKVVKLPKGQIFQYKFVDVLFDQGGMVVTTVNK